jgi:hypothetical protein
MILDSSTHCLIPAPRHPPTARLSRITVPDLPHHVTQRGNRRQALFTEPGDYALDRDLWKLHPFSGSPATERR